MSTAEAATKTDLTALRVLAYILGVVLRLPLLFVAFDFEVPFYMLLSARAPGGDEQNRTGPTRLARGASVANGMLAALPRKQYQRLLRGLESVALTFGEVLYEPGVRIRHVYFPNDSLVSLLTLVEGHLALEVGMVGREGMLGLPLALGRDVSPVRALVQGAGTAMRMKSARFSEEIRKSPELREEINRYTVALMAQITQTAACNRFHVVGARLARWLLMTRDRVGSDEFRLTHEFLGHMLGVRRVGVTNAARALQKGKLIAYSRGKIRILDRQRLEAAACSCYALVKDMNGSVRR
jgi:CRP-like cAMP-binding protein